jgi:hypothetical protein
LIDGTMVLVMGAPAILTQDLVRKRRHSYRFATGLAVICRGALHNSNSRAHDKS